MNHYSVYQIRRASEEFGIPFKKALWHRKTCLQSLLDKLTTDFEFEDDAILLHWMASDIKAIQKEIASISREMDNIGAVTRDDQITDEMIARAKEYPVDRLVIFDKGGKSLAWCHDDKSPSLSLWKKGNKAVCFPCDKKFDSIDILVQRDGLSFHEAVRRLQ